MLEVFAAIIAATAGQVLLARQDPRGLLLYALGILILLIALRQEGRKDAFREDKHNENQSQRVGCHSPPHFPPMGGMQEVGWYRRFLLLLVLPLAVANAIVAFLAAADNTYRWFGVAAWALAIVLFLALFWEYDRSPTLTQRLGISRDGWHLSWIALLVVGLLLVGFFFRFWRLDDMPSEVTSDHIEKLLDVHDLVTGERPIFFFRNTGREPWQFYWTLMLIRVFDLDTKFFALKLGTAIIGLLTLPGVYLLGREVFGRWVGLWALLFTAIASWPVILSRVGLRFPLAPAATAWSLLFLLRGLRYGRRNDFLLLGLCLGIGLHGYTAFRAMPLAVIVCWGLVLIIRPRSVVIHPTSIFVRNAALTVIIAAVVLIPLGRFSLENPDDFWFRSFNRVADPNQPMTDGVPITFIKNLANLAVMLHWKGDDVWVNTLSEAPVLDPLLGGLLVLGIVILLWRGLRLRDACAPLLLIAGIILLLPSALSLAYPMENPSVVRTGGAIPAIMVIVAFPISLGMERGLREMQAKGQMDRSGSRGNGSLSPRRWRSALLVLVALTLAAVATGVNYRRYFVDYWEQYERNALNTTEIASAIDGFIESGGDPANAWIIAWPYWIDTRGAGIELGDPPWNNVILKPEELNEQANSSLDGTRSSPNAARPRFYVLHPEDRRSLEQLWSLFPDGWSKLYTSKRPGRHFVLFYVPRTPPRGFRGGSKGMAADEG
jgi:hypothetical protein